ncbi:MAG: hypothetical protein AB2A00_08205 [Myxococcota bacterium]
MPAGTVAYITDVEGRWDKLTSFAAANPHVSLDGDGKLTVAPGVVLVFGGDAIDRGPQGRRVVRTLLDARRRQPSQVVLLAGNRDINKMRLRRELDGHPPPRTPEPLRTGARAELLKWIFGNTMGARHAFEMRRQELGRERAVVSDEEVTESFLTDLSPDGALSEYLSHCQLAYRHGATLFVHGAVGEHSLGVVPGESRVDDVDRWVRRLNDWYTGQVQAYREDARDRDGQPRCAPLVAYQAPLPGTRLNQESVVYGRPTDEEGVAHLPPPDVVQRLQRAGVSRVVVGHTPNGDSPSVVRAEGFELVLADNSYGRLEEGSQVVITDETFRSRVRIQLDDGTTVEARIDLVRGEPSPVGRRLVDTGHLVKGQLPHEHWLLYRPLKEFKMEQRAVSDVELRARLR